MEHDVQEIHAERTNRSGQNDLCVVKTIHKETERCKWTSCCRYKSPNNFRIENKMKTATTNANCLLESVDEYASRSTIRGHQQQMEWSGNR